MTTLHNLSSATPFPQPKRIIWSSFVLLANFLVLLAFLATLGERLQSSENSRDFLFALAIGQTFFWNAIALRWTRNPAAMLFAFGFGSLIAAWFTAPLYPHSFQSTWTLFWVLSLIQMFMALAQRIYREADQRTETHLRGNETMRGQATTPASHQVRARYRTTQWSLMQQISWVTAFGLIIGSYQWLRFDGLAAFPFYLLGGAIFVMVCGWCEELLDRKEFDSVAFNLIVAGVGVLILSYTFQWSNETFFFAAFSAGCGAWITFCLFALRMQVTKEVDDRIDTAIADRTTISNGSTIPEGNTIPVTILIDDFRN